MKALRSVTTYLSHELEPEHDDFYISHYEEYDTEGRTVLEIKYVFPGDEESRIEFDYGQDDLVSEKRLYAAGGELIQRESFRRNPQGELEEFVTEYPGSGVTRQTFERKGNVELIVTKDEDGGIEEETRKVYDVSGAYVSEEFKYDSAGEVMEHKIEWFDSEGKLLKGQSFGHTPQEFWINDFIYDPNGNLVEQTITNENGLFVGRTRWVYGPDGEELEKDENGVITKCIYDQAGNHIKTEFYNRDTKLTAYHLFSYNQFGMLEQEVNYSMGHSYFLEPAVVGRDQSSKTVKRYEYEFY